jgi:hypothetical protein
MRRSVIPAALVLWFLAVPGDAPADDDRLRRYELPDADTLELILPPGWQDEVDVQPGEDELTIELRPAPGGSFEAYVTPQRNGRAPGMIQDAESLRAAARDAAARLAGPSAAGMPEIRRLQGTDGVGFYFVAADPAPPPEEFGILVQGWLMAGDLILRFELLTHDPDDPAIAQTLGLLEHAVHRARDPEGP